MKIRENRDHVVELMGRKVRAWHLGGQIPHSWLALHQTHGISGMPCTEPSTGTLTWGKFCNMAKFSVWSVHFWKDDVWSLFFSWVAITYFDTHATRLHFLLTEPKGHTSTGHDHQSPCFCTSNSAWIQDELSTSLKARVTAPAPLGSLKGFKHYLCTLT